MKKILFLIFIAIVLFALIFKFYVVPQSQNNILNTLSNIGFSPQVIDDYHVGFQGISIPKIQLDKDGFNSAENIDVQINWLTALAKPSPKSISIETLKISSVVNNARDILNLKNILQNEKTKNISLDNLRINNIIWDVSTSKSAIRITGDLTLTTEDDNIVITSKLNANQHELRFDSDIKSIITPTNDINFDLAFNNLNIVTNIVKINRGAGWLNLSDSNSTRTSITAQMDSGSGSILDVPAKNINLVMNTDEHSYPVLLRAQAAGIDDVNLYGDFKFSPDIEHQLFDLVLNIDEPNKFVNYLKQQNIIKQNISGSYPSAATEVTFKYKAEDRFADGPLPFALKAQSNKNNVNGTVLFYPKKLDVRGTVNGNKEILNLLESLFVIDDKNKEPDAIRLDSNLKSLL